jgi:hypothetical protein
MANSWAARHLDLNVQHCCHQPMVALAPFFATLQDVMSTPPIALKSTGKVADAAVCMTEVR